MSVRSITHYYAFPQQVPGRFCAAFHNRLVRARELWISVS
jgi:hypothetical protein